ncbi:membrane protein insertase YidC [Saxibacter everestensis]|uniref:membrane protein insertase YidC n=1 Tax=Saxibacter everestensis TaxID=2909229 RepID=UPI003D80A8A0
MEWLDTILFPIKWVVAYILFFFHEGLKYVGMDAASGWTWSLSIVGLVLVIRIVLIPLFVRQIKAQRAMQLVQPEVQKLQAKYKGKTDSFSRQAMAQEQMALFKKHGTSPFSSCLPILAQMPIFFSLFRVLHTLPDIATGKLDPLGPITADIAGQIESSTIFGAQLSATFLSSPDLNVKILTVIMILLMSASQFITQKQIMAKNMSEAAMNNPFMKQQKMMLYLFPIVFAVGGVNFPVGVLIYWLVSNLWTMGQQFYVIQRMPSPGSPAEKALMERRVKKGKSPLPGMKKLEADDEPEQPRGQRQQPVRKDRVKPKTAPTTPNQSRPSADKPGQKAPNQNKAPQNKPKGNQSKPTSSPKKQNKPQKESP